MRSRYFSSCATARFITSALWSTKGRISSPAPNLSPTSFMAGSSTSFSVGTAPIFSTEASICASTPSFLRRRMCQCRASSGSMPAVGSAASEESASRALGPQGGMKPSSASRRGVGLEVGDEALERVVAAAEDQVVGELALLGGDLAVGRDVVRVDHRQVQPGLDAVVQEDGVEDGAGAGGGAERDVRDAQRGPDARQRLLDAADALDRLDRGRLPLVVAGREREGEDVEDQQLAVEAVGVAQLRDALRDLDLAIGGLRHADLVDRERNQRGAVLDGERRDDVELRRAGLEVDGVD